VLHIEKVPDSFLGKSCSKELSFTQTSVALEVLSHYLPQLIAVYSLVISQVLSSEVQGGSRLPEDRNVDSPLVL
jgi:hypothetical protein